MTQKEILRVLSQVVHPEQTDNIVVQGLVENIQVNDKKISLTLHFRKVRDPFATAIKQQCEKNLQTAFPQYECEVKLEFAEPKKVEKKPEVERRDTLQKVKNTIAIVSGKGGVGKSTIAANMAITLAQKGYKVGLIDADIYGPSIPKMFGVENEKPTANSENLIIPVEKYGVKMLSVGFFVDPKDALMWRAPMATGALKQLLLQADWGELDFLMIDMPPGTGDIHLTLVNELNLTGAVVVSTPQQIALADALKGITMLRHENVKVKVLGLVENMAWFTPAELPDNRYYIFGKGGVKMLADELQIPLLGEVPIIQSICDNGDSGTPAALHSGLPKKAFEEVVNNMLAQLK
ncbi:MAG: P-loop NTPase [Prevotellaceae bacterium]|jgi:ATP-binding protein involved in chromosome partitioning|nr:P-loop NTPase [Prevotellaceae bacterium]